MKKIIVTLVLSFFTLLTSVSFNAEAAVKKNKKKSAKTTISKSTKKKSKKYAKNNRRRRGGSSVDLRALTTESPYTDNPDGINPVETKSGIE